MLVRYMAVLMAVALAACNGGKPKAADKGVLVLHCVGEFSGTDTARSPTAQGYRINFDAKTIEYKDVRLGTWHAELGQRVFRADAQTISFDGQDPPSPYTSPMHYTLQFDRKSGRVVDGQRLFFDDVETGAGVVESQFAGTCQPVDTPAGASKF